MALLNTRSLLSGCCIGLMAFASTGSAQPSETQAGEASRTVDAATTSRSGSPAPSSANMAKRYGAAKEQTALGRVLSMFAADADAARYDTDTGLAWGAFETAEGNDNAYRRSAKIRLLGFGPADLPAGAGSDLKMVKGNGGDSWLTIHGFRQGSVYSLYVQKPYVPDDDAEGVDYARLIADQLDSAVITPLAVNCAKSADGDGPDTQSTAFYSIKVDGGTIWMAGTVEEGGKYSGGNIILNFTREEPAQEMNACTGK